MGSCSSQDGSFGKRIIGEDGKEGNFYTLGMNLHVFSQTKKVMAPSASPALRAKSD